MKIKIMLMFLLVAGICMAQKAKHLVLMKNDGTEVTFVMTDNPVITFSENNFAEMNVSTEKTTIVVPTQALNMMIIDDRQLGGVENVIMPNENVSYEITSEALVFNVSSGSAQLGVYTMDGKVIVNKVLKDGEYYLCLSDLPTGHLVITLNDNSIKIFRR